MFKLGKIFGQAFVLALYAGIAYDGAVNIINHRSIALDLFMVLFVLVSQQLGKTLYSIFQVLDIAALILIELNQSDVKEKSVDDIFKSIVEDL
jgi:hypothetical protein